MNYYVNPYIKNTERIFPMQGRGDFKRYDMNENPSGLPKEFVDRVLREITPEFLATYPEPNRFLHRYSETIGVPFSYLTATNGSDMAIRYALSTFGEVGKKVLTVTPTFEMYAVNCNILGYIHEGVPYESDWTIKVESILDAIDSDTRVVVLVNPNNPLGNPYTMDEARKVAEKAKEVGAVLLIDEAYHYFYEGTLLPLVREFSNVMVFRTFSKMFSLAALRVGVVIADPEMIHYLNNGKLTFDVNAVGLLFAERILEEPELLSLLKKDYSEGKKYMAEELTKCGYTFKMSEGNYLFIRTKHDAHEVTNLLEKREKVLVHPYGNPLLHDYIRVSIGSVEDMQYFMEALKRVDGE